MKKALCFILIITIFLLNGCQSNSTSQNESDKITKGTSENEETVNKDDKKNEQSDGLPALDLSNPIKVRRSPGSKHDALMGSDDNFPKYDENNTDAFQIDLRNSDLTRYDLKDKLQELLHADFNTSTTWPESLPAEFDYNKILENGKNPGLDTKSLHEKGITGKNISIGIIDSTLFTDHEEIKDNLKYYEEIGPVEPTATMHGSAVTSIACGKTLGVAPDANLYYIAAPAGTVSGNDVKYDFTYISKAINRLLEINTHLNDDEKIRVISISVGWSPKDKGYDEIEASITKAKEEGILIVSSSVKEDYGFYFHGLDRNPNDDPNFPNNYRPANWIVQNFCESQNEVDFNKILFVPMGNRTTASEVGPNDYVYYCVGGWSWCIPYISGLYALACQADPNITYNEFWDIALSTAVPVDFEYNGKNYTVPKVVQPQKIIETIQHK